MSDVAQVSLLLHDATRHRLPVDRQNGLEIRVHARPYGTSVRAFLHPPERAMSTWSSSTRRFRSFHFLQMGFSPSCMPRIACVAVQNVEGSQ
eukprot:scaffold98215_cov54-Phaeocystis_antarctica.AAC.4